MSGQTKWTKLIEEALHDIREERKGFTIWQKLFGKHYAGLYITIICVLLLLMFALA